MSQAKVDKYKEEKKNRSKNIKKNKIKKILLIFLGAAVVGVLIGFPLGKHLYNLNYEKRMENATISTGLYSYWFDEHWAANYDDLYPDTTEATDTSDTGDISDEDLAKIEEAIKESLATGTDGSTPSDVEIIY